MYAKYHRRWSEDNREDTKEKIVCTGIVKSTRMEKGQIELQVVVDKECIKCEVRVDSWSRHGPKSQVSHGHIHFAVDKRA